MEWLINPTYTYPTQIYISIFLNTSVVNIGS